MSSPDPGTVRAAVEAGDIVALAKLAAQVPGFPEGRSDEWGGTWIEMAVAHGSPSVVRWMIGKGVRLDRPEDYDFTLLQTCLQRPDEARYDMLSALIELGADIDARGYSDWTALHHAAVAEDYPAMRMLLGAGADRSIRTRIDDCATAEEEARALGHPDAADFIRDYRTARAPPE